MFPFSFNLNRKHVGCMFKRFVCKLSHSLVFFFLNIPDPIYVVIILNVLTL
jgi:hypothetical protein